MTLSVSFALTAQQIAIVISDSIVSYSVIVSAEIAGYVTDGSFLLRVFENLLCIAVFYHFAKVEESGLIGTIRCACCMLWVTMTTV